MAHKKNTLPWLVSDVIGCFLFRLLQCLLVFITGAFPILAYCANKHGSQYFQDIIRELLGPRAYFATQILLVLFMFGATITYMIVIGDQMEKGMWSFSFLCLSCWLRVWISHLIYSTSFILKLENLRQQKLESRKICRAWVMIDSLMAESACKYMYMWSLVWHKVLADGVYKCDESSYLCNNH